LQSSSDKQYIPPISIIAAETEIDSEKCETSNAKTCIEGLKLPCALEQDAQRGLGKLL